MRAVFPGRISRLFFFVLLSLAALPGLAAARPIQKQQTLPPGVVRSEEPNPTLRITPGSPQARRFLRSTPPLEETVVYDDSLNKLRLDSLGGWTHVDESGSPTAWNIATFLACQNHAWWCGVTDSSWTFDTNRSGYGNSWNQQLNNYCPTESIPNNQSLSAGFKFHLDTETNYDYIYFDVYDQNEGWVHLWTKSGKDPNGSGCDTVSIAIPDVVLQQYLNFPTDSGTVKAAIPFRFSFVSDLAYSSEDGLYNGDGFSFDNITFKGGNKIVFFDDMEGGMKNWQRTVAPPVGDYFRLASNVVTEDLCNQNRTNVWIDTSPLTFSLVPGLDNVLNTPPIYIEKSSQVAVYFDVYRSLPLFSCFYYHLNFRTKNVGDTSWSNWTDPTRLLYYGSQKDWARQRVVLPGATNKDSLQVQFGLKDYSQIYCDGVSSPAGVYAHFDNIAVAIVKNVPPFFVTRDVDLFNSTFQTTAFWKDDNFNTPLGDSMAVQVNTSRGYQSGFLNYRINGGSFSTVPLHRTTPALPNYFDVDVPPGNYPANTKLEYYFSVTDSTGATGYEPFDAISDQDYLQAAILPLKTAINLPLGCSDSLAQILLVNHYYGREPEPLIQSALKDMGYKFDVWNVLAPTSGIGNCLGGSDPASIQYHWPVTDVTKLTQYSTIIWHSGDMRSFTITPQDEAVLQTWIQQPGKSRNFWISGDNVGWELFTSADYNGFLQFTCGARYVRDIWENTPQDSLRPIVKGVPGGPAGPRFLHANGDCPLIDDFDMVAVSSSAPTNGKAGLLLTWPTTWGAATRYATNYNTFQNTDSARVVFQGFNFSDITEGGERLQLTKNIVTDYFKVPACYVASGVEDNPPGAPSFENILGQNSPNPFNPQTTIRYSVAQPGMVEIRIYSVTGALVRTLVNRVHSPGVYSAQWNGTDDRGRPLASGAYFYRIESNGFRDSKKLILLR